MIEMLERLLNIYKVTTRRYYTSYYQDVEKRGILTGGYYHMDNYQWVEGRHPDIK